MAGSMDIRSRFVDLGVDGEGGSIDGFVTDDYIAVLVYEDEV